MFLNNGGGSGGGGGETNITINGSTNHSVETLTQMQSISSPKSGDICHVAITQELYIYKNNTWTLIPTGDAFYNKLSTTTQIGHVQLTSDVTLDTEDVAITPKALKQIYDELKELIKSQNWEELEESEWDDLNDGVDDNPTLSQWDDLNDGVDDTESDHFWEDFY